LSSKEVRLIINADSRVAYDRSGYILFLREQSLMALPFDAAKLQISGDPFPIAESIRYNSVTGAASLTVSENGVLAYRSGNAVTGNNYKLTWFDRTGKALSSLGEVGSYADPQLSPDGKKLAIERMDPTTRTSDIWIFDVTRGVPARLTFDPGNERFPVWSPNGERIVFSSIAAGTAAGLYAKASNGAGNEDLIIQMPATTVWDWTPDGKSLVFGGGREISILHLAGNPSPVTYLPASNFVKLGAQVSPDGQWLAYMTNESGKAEVYVQAFPTPSGKRQISTNGGSSPRWRRDGKEIFYIAADQKLVGVPVNPSPKGFEISTPEALFQVPQGSGGFVTSRTAYLPRQQYDVTADGQRFLFNVIVDESAETPITVVTNWTASLPAR